MTEILRYFMWGYQSHFQIFLKRSAEELFTGLDPALRPRVFLLGFRQSADEAFEPICIDPEEFSEGYDVTFFTGVPAMVHELLAPTPGVQRLITGPVELYEERDQRWAWSRAVTEALEREDVARGWRSFVSSAMPVGSFRVVCVLQLRAASYERYPRLRRGNAGDFHGWPSLLDAVASEFLSVCAKALRVPEPGSSFDAIDRRSEQMLRDAGSTFALNVPALLGSWREGQSLYQRLTDLAAMRYEGALNRGTLLLARKSHPNVEEVIRLRREVSLGDARGARKLLEMATGDLLALSDAERIYGLGRVMEGYDPSREDLFLVDFVAERSWHLSHAGSTLMRVRDGVPSLPARPPEEGKLMDVLERVFGPVGGADLVRLRDLISAATRQRHGTMIVISDHAEDEATRLAAQSTPVEPFRVEPEQMHSLTAIDGAILLDPGGTCHAIGVILDGLASARGTSSRGARYNSALRYEETVRRHRQHHCVAVVVSEDGPVDVHPDLKPRISRPSLRQRTERLEQLALEPEVGLGEFFRIMHWLTEHEFYLAPDVARRVNALRQVVAAKLEPAEVGEIRPVWPDLAGNPGLDDSYFIE